MFKRKLKALDYQSDAPFNPDDEALFRNLILWIEEQKIRHYKIEDRAMLRETESTEWDKGYQKYMNDLGCPINNKRNEEIEWLLTYAIRLEYTDDDKAKIIKSHFISIDNKLINFLYYIVDRYRVVKKREALLPSSNPLEFVNVHSDECKIGVAKLAKLLNVVNHPDHLVTLRAISKLVKTRLNHKALENPDTVVVKGIEFPLEQADDGLKESGDPTIRHAIRVLRCLYIEDIRNLQTNINECIVALQCITADPRTDTSIGRVGM